MLFYPMASSTASPRATLTPVYFADPPVWNTDVGPIPQKLQDVLTPLPPAAAACVKAAVCVPFYSEDGYALDRGLQSLALQRADLRKFHSSALLARPEALPELHVFAIADGWKQAGGARILSDSMLETITELFGPTLDVDALMEYMVRATHSVGAHGISMHTSTEKILYSYIYIACVI